MRDEWALHVLGCRGSFPVCGEKYLEFGGATSCYILKKGDRAVVLDCGSGLFMAAPLLRDCRQIDVLLGHLHYDHIIGLLNWGVFPGSARTRLISTFDKWFGQDCLKRFMGPPFWPYTPANAELVTVESPGDYDLGEGVKARFHPSNHPDGANLYRVDFDGKSICFACDFEHDAPFPDYMAENCDILIYDAMYTREEYPLHAGWGHSCWQEGRVLADRVNAGLLLIAHHDPARSDEDLRAMEREALKEREPLRFAREGDIFSFKSEGGIRYEHRG